jgi:hypothetical protein
MTTNLLLFPISLSFSLSLARARALILSFSLSLSLSLWFPPHSSPVLSNFQGELARFFLLLDTYGGLLRLDQIR